MPEHDIAGWVTQALLLLIVTQFGVQQWLLARQARHVVRHRPQVPPAFEASIDLATHQRAADYTLAMVRLSMWTVAMEAAILLGWTLLGGLEALNRFLRAVGLDGQGGAWSAVADPVVLVLAVTLIGGALELPAGLYRQFVIERRFGFNRMSPGLFAGDVLKSAMLSVLIGAPLLGLVILLMQAAGSVWWLWAFALIAGFQLLMMVVVPTWIAPLFNRFTPLQDPELESRVRRLMERCGFRSKGLLVMDGSRRSSHANAYFTGLGRSKRVVFFDTLLQALSPAEVEAVLAHELGHFRRGHIPQRLVMILGMTLLVLAGLGAASGHAGFYLGLGVTPSLTGPNEGLALALFGLVLPPLLFLLTPVAAWWSRRHEFEADAYAADHSDRHALASALVKLHADNAATLTPDPWYVRFHYSHPPAVQRLAALGLAMAPTGASAAPNPTPPQPI